MVDKEDIRFFFGERGSAKTPRVHVDGTPRDFGKSEVVARREEIIIDLLDSKDVDTGEDCNERVATTNDITTGLETVDDSTKLIPSKGFESNALEGFDAASVEPNSSCQVKPTPNDIGTY